MNTQHHMSLPLRLLLGCVLVTGVYALVMVIALDHTLSGSLERRAQRRGELILHTLTNALTTLTDRHDLERLISATSAEPEVSEIEVVVGGRIVASSSLRLIGRTAQALPAEQTRLFTKLAGLSGGSCAPDLEHHHVDCAARTTLTSIRGNPEAALVYVKIATDEIAQETAALLRQICGWVFGLLVPLIGLVIGTVQRQLVAPVTALTRAARSPDIRRALRNEAPIASREIAHLANALLEAESAQRAAQATLASNLERFDLAITGASEVIWDTDLRDNRTYFSPRLAELLGLAPAVLPVAAAEFEALVHPEDLPGFRAAIVAHIRDRIPYAATYRLRHADGGYRWIAARGQALWGANGRATRIAGSLRDVTAEKALADERAALHARLSTLIENLPGVAFEYRPNQDEGEITLFGEARTRLFDVADATAEGANASESGWLPVPFVLRNLIAEDSGDLWRSIDKAVSAREHWSHEFRVTAPNGDTVWVEGRSSPRPAADGTLIFTGTMIDVTARKQAELDARRNQTLLNEVLDGARAVMFRCNVDEDWRVVYMSEGIAQIAGYPADAFTAPGGRRFIDLMHPDDLAVAQQRVAAALANGGPWDIEYRLRCADGSERWIASRGTVVYDAHGHATHVDGTLFDIQALKDSERALRDSEARLQLIVQGGDLGTWEWDLAADELIVNARWCEFRALPVLPRISLERAGSIVHPEDREGVQRALEAHFAGSAPLYEAQYRVRDARGEWRWLIDRGRVVARDAQGKPVRLAGTNRDISVRKHAEARAREAQALLRTVLDMLPQRVFWKDRNGRYLGSNRAFAADHGFDNVTGLTLHDLGYDPRTTASYEQSDNRMLATGESEIDRVVRHEKPDGAAEWISYSKAPLRDAAGRIIGVVGTYLDVTAFKDTEFVLIAARDAAEGANRAKTDFLSNMSHEIRTPLNGVLGCAELLRATATREQVQLVDTILGCGRSLLTLLNDILDLSKIEAGGLRLDHHIAPPREICAEAVELMAPRALEKGLDLTLVWHPGTPAAIATDAHRVKQVLTNLIGNAVKFTAQGEIVVDVSATAEGGLHVAVRDTGIGIPADRQQAIFERFTQADGSTTRRYGGTGLGLAISQRLVEALGGRIGVDSVPGEGATFWFTLPAGIDPLPPEDPAPLRVTRALVVSTSATRCQALGFDLAALGLEYRCVASLPDAVAALTGFAAEVLLVDLAGREDAPAALDTLCATQPGRRVVALCTQTQLGSLDHACFDAVLTLPLTRLSRLIDALSPASFSEAAPARAAVA